MLRGSGLAIALAAALWLEPATPACANEWPSRPVKIVVASRPEAAPTNSGG
jgi:hypothetical protein